ncbi:hypothetical protein P692DRAFT_201724527 [Suillus brevipes Sb2]|nr:hypothetical protein P692DRAFT_201724527 [Suillus brevipes Sb2]
MNTSDPLRPGSSTHLLTPLPTKASEQEWPGWTTNHQDAFDAIKRLVVSRDCLTSIDHNNLVKSLSPAT